MDVPTIVHQWDWMRINPGLMEHSSDKIAVLRRHEHNTKQQHNNTAGMKNQCFDEQDQDSRIWCAMRPVFISSHFAPQTRLSTPPRSPPNRPSLRSRIQQHACAWWSWQQSTKSIAHTQHSWKRIHRRIDRSLRTPHTTHTHAVGGARSSAAS